uniref:DNA 3'-5' helicase n=1 Tax=Echinococcus granulosus TaxID=6210 RepID=A0A068WB61_ECHGR|nr:ATP dependent DNA helicase Q4 [Echinococcus granulosus]
MVFSTKRLKTWALKSSQIVTSSAAGSSIHVSGLSIPFHVSIPELLYPLAHVLPCEMADPNPWDELPSSSGKLTKPQMSRSQTVMASRLKANILTGGLGSHLPDKICPKSRLPKFGTALFSRHRSVFSPLCYVNRELTTYKENIAPSSLVVEPSLESKENPLILSLTNHISNPSFAERKCRTSNAVDVDGKFPVDVSESTRLYSESNSFKVEKMREVVKKTGSFMSAEFRDLSEATQTVADALSSDDATVQSNKCLRSIEIPTSPLPVASVMTDKPSASATCPITTSVGAVAARTFRAVSPGNYVKLNLRKKSFSRGGTRRQALSRLQIRRAKFAKKFGTKGCRAGKFFRCNPEGHWGVKYSKNFPESRVHPNDKGTEEMGPDHAQVECRIADLVKLRSQFPEGPRLCELLNIGREAPGTQFSMQKGANFDLMEVRTYMNELMHKLRIRSLRPSQERAIWRTLAGKSTLLVLPTGGGKSLCYQIPAAIFQDDSRGHYAYVLMSPEALVESDWILRQNRLPPISFVCIDEAHCLADWSHHFRPAYLQICNLFRSRLGVNHFLGLSATCTPSTIKNICQNLGMGDAVKLNTECDAKNPLNPSDPDGGYLQPFPNPIPTNLLVTASMDHNRDEALIRILQRPPFSEQPSILIYAASRDLTERLAGYIRTRLQEVKEKIGRRTVGWNTAVYHAGLSPKERVRVQKRFMDGRIRVLVATSAFGMGLNKQDLQAVIHFSLPKSFENYIQEIGRVGRNGQQSFCHIFLAPGFSSMRTQNNTITDEKSVTLTPEEAREANELRRHIFANHIDSVQLKRVLGLVFGDGDSTDINGSCRPVVALDTDQIAEQLDIKTESLTTLITYMHLRSDVPPLITVLPPGPMGVTVSCYGGPLELAHVSTRSLAVSAWLGHLKSRATAAVGFTTTNLREVSLDLVTLCNAWGWRPDAVLRELRGLEWDSGVAPGAPPRRTGVSVALSGTPRASWLWVHTDSQLAERLDSELAYLRRRLQEVERAGLRSLVQLQSAIALVAVDSVDEIDFNQDYVRARSARFHARVEAHFSETVEEIPSTWPPPISAEKEQSVRVTVREFMHLYGQNLGRGQVTGRVVANIFHGIGSPNFPATAWSRVHRFWRACLDVDWPTLQRIATNELITAHFAFS